MQLRHARAEDVEQVAVLEQLSFHPEEQISEAVLSYYLTELPETCLVMEDGGGIAGYLLAIPIAEERVTDAIFHEPQTVKVEGEYLAIACLTAAPDYMGQGVGRLLLAALKEVAVTKQVKGISLTCKDELISYYQQQGFEDIGLSQSQLGGGIWYDMYWKA